jgi:hypothetical protein
MQRTPPRPEPDYLVDYLVLSLSKDGQRKPSVVRPVHRWGGESGRGTRGKGGTRGKVSATVEMIQALAFLVWRGHPICDPEPLQ